MKKLAVTIWMVLAVASVSPGTEVWTSDFSVDGDPDGVVDLFDNNSSKEMIGATTNGFLTILTADDSLEDLYTPDKAGRPLGTTMGSANSFSGLYRFQWTDVWGDPVLQDGSVAFEVAGFLGNHAAQTRQVVGALMIHWQIADGNYYVNLGTIVGGSGDQVIDLGGGSTLLGLDAEGQDYALAVGWDGTTNTVKVELFNGLLGTSIKSYSDVISSPPPNVLDFQMTHFGWGDYTGNPDSLEKLNVWAVDALTYYDSFSEAFDAVVPVTGKVWESTFDIDGEFDRFADVIDGRPTAMLNSNGAQGGKLGVRQIDDDAGGAPFSPDKSGRSVGAGLDETYSWSALYRFRWTDLPAQESPQTYQFTGAFGPLATQARDVVGALMTHWQVVNDHYVNLGLIMGGTGDQQIDQSGGAIYLGPDAETTDYQLAIGWDTDTDTLSAGLYLADGTPVVGSNGVPMSMQVSVPTSLVTDYEITHIGWSDYTGDIGQVNTIDWQVDSVAFWLNDAAAAFDEATGKVASDLDGDGDVDLDDYVILADCLAGPNVSTPPGGCTQGEFDDADLDNDIDVDLGDFAVFQEEFGG